MMKEPLSSDLALAMTRDYLADCKLHPIESSRKISIDKMVERKNLADKTLLSPTLFYKYPSIHLEVIIYDDTVRWTIVCIEGICWNMILLFMS